MIKVLLIILAIITLVILFLYFVGKKVKQNREDFEKKIKKMAYDKELKKAIEKQKRQSTPKVPRIK